MRTKLLVERGGGRYLEGKLHPSVPSIMGLLPFGEEQAKHIIQQKENY